jgi:hypothetical protein
MELAEKISQSVSVEPEVVELIIRKSHQSNKEKGDLFEKNRREYWNNRSDVLDVFRDTHGKADLSVVKNNGQIYLIEIKKNGVLAQKDIEELEELITETPDNVEVRVEFLEDLGKSNGHTNTSYTRLKSVESIKRHKDKISNIRSEAE